MTNRMVAVAATALAIASWQPAHASSHCSEVLDTVEQIFAELNSQTATCEAALNSARQLMEQGREQASACGCEAAAESFQFSIGKSNSADYSCGNKRQGLGTMRSSIPDAIDCCDGC